jgi:C4-dicarboxylate transporter
MFKDLTFIILGVAICYAYFFWQDYKNKKEIKKQERLNAIKTN